MSDLIRLAPGLTLDADYVAGGTFALLGKKGSGKSFTTRVLAEEFWRAGVQFVLIDPMGANWGLRSSADGQGEGLPIPIFGGKHADAPLERTAGALMADLVVRDRLSMILDLSEFGSHAAERQFVHDFLDRLYRTNDEDLVHVLLDEADLYAPQKPAPGDQAVKGVVDNTVRRGRNKAIAITLITQRSAVLDKDVLTQCDGVVLLRLTGPQDRDAAMRWVETHGEPEENAAVRASLPELKNGEAWIWIPELKVFERVQIRMSRTFDSSPTRTRKGRGPAPKGYADVDLAAISEKIAATIDRAKAEDPKELRKQLAELRRELTKRPTETKVETKTVTETVEIPVLGDEALGRLEEAVEALAAAAGRIVSATNEVGAALGKLKARPPAPVAAPPVPRTQARQQVAPTPRAPRADHEYSAPTPAQQRILNALAALEVIGVRSPSKIQLALFAQASPKSSGYTNNLGALRTAGLIDYPAPGAAALTADGRAIADHAHAPRTHEELLAYVRTLVGPARSRIVDALVDVYPDALPKDELAARAGASASSSGYTNNLGSLRSLGLIDYPSPGYAVATGVLFLEAA
jgi:hypothetical protein